MILLGCCFVSNCGGRSSIDADHYDSLLKTFEIKRDPVVHTHVFRESIPQLSSRTDLVKGERIRHDRNHQVVFCIRQNNMDELIRILHDVSDPLSSNYGQHLTREEVADLTSNPESRDAVVSYLNLIGASVISETLSGEYITANATVAVWEVMFNTEFFTFHKTHHIDQRVEKVVRAEKYWVPRELDMHVESVFNTIEMPLDFMGRLPKLSPASRLKTMDGVTAVISGVITPYKLKTYYNMSITAGGSSNSSQGIFGGAGQYFSPVDLLSFQVKFGLPQVPVTASIGNHSSNSKCVTNSNNCGESNLDLQYLTAMSPGSPTTFWYTDSSFSVWLLALANTPKPPLVLSISYGGLEKDFSSSDMDAFTTQAIKLAAMGVTLLASSGDDGANSYYAMNGSYCGYYPTFPASNPFVVSVGGTSVSRQRVMLRRHECCTLV